MIVTKFHIERKVSDLNDQILQLEKISLRHPDLAEKKANRAYYVNKLVEMDELNLKSIKM